MNLEYRIQIEIDTLGYAINEILNQLILDNLGQWHLVAYFLQKIILAKTWYKTYNNELFTIIKIFKK